MQGWGEPSYAKDKRDLLVLKCSSLAGNLLLQPVGRHQMIGCGLPCAGPAVWGAEVVPVGADLI